MYACQVCAELRFLLSQAQLKKEEAEREVRDISSKLGRQLELVEQVRETFIGHTGESLPFFFFFFCHSFCNSQCYWYKIVFTSYVQKMTKKSFHEQ